MGAGFETRYINEVSNIFVEEKSAFNYAEILKKYNKKKEFFRSYSKIEIKHAKSERLLNSLSFSSYSLIEVLKLKNLYKEEGTPIKVVVLDKEGKEYDYLKIQKELEKFI